MLEQLQEYVTNNPNVALGIIAGLIALVVYMYFRESFSVGPRRKKKSKKVKSITLPEPEPANGDRDDEKETLEQFDDL